MRTLALAGTELSSSRLGFGLSGLHHLRRSGERQRLLAAALHGGISYFDTSPFYGHGLAERELGIFAQGRRGRLLIATKFGIQPNWWMNRFPALMYARLAANAALRRLTHRPTFVVAKRHDYSAAAATASLDRSLKALRTDHVDILYLHDPTVAVLAQPDLLRETLQGLQTSGKVRYFGLAGSPADCAAIRARHPGLSHLLQLDASTGNEALDRFNVAHIPFHSSYGHFRGRGTGVQESLRSAVASNREGVILFSTRRGDRIDSMIRLLTDLEPG